MREGSGSRAAIPVIVMTILAISIASSDVQGSKGTITETLITNPIAVATYELKVGDVLEYSYTASRPVELAISYYNVASNPSGEHPPVLAVNNLTHAQGTFRANWTGAYHVAFWVPIHWVFNTTPPIIISYDVHVQTWLEEWGPTLAVAGGTAAVAVVCSWAVFRTKWKRKVV